MKKYTFVTISSINDEVAKQWKKLWHISDNAKVFNSYEWFLTSKESNKNKKYKILMCYFETRLVAILPVWNTSVFGINTWMPVGFKYSGTPFLIETYEEELVTFFFEEIIKLRNIYIPKVDFKITSIIHDSFPKIFFALTSVNPYIDKNEDPERFSSTLNHKSLRKTMRKFSDKLHVEVYSKKSDLNKQMKILFELEQKSSKKIKNMDLFSNKSNKDFFMNLVKYCTQFISIMFLYYEGIPIVYTFALRYKGAFLSYQSSYLSEYAKLSPGKAMIIHELESLRDTNINFYDLGGGVSSYKLEFAPDFYFLYDLWYSNNILIMVWWKLINKLRRIKQIVFPIKNTRDHEFLFKTYE